MMSSPWRTRRPVAGPRSASRSAARGRRAGRLMKGLAPLMDLRVDRLPSLGVEGLALELAQDIRPLGELGLELIAVRHQLRILLRGEIVDEPAAKSRNLAHLLIGRVGLRP